MTRWWGRLLQRLKFGPGARHYSALEPPLDHLVANVVVDHLHQFDRAEGVSDDPRFLDLYFQSRHGMHLHVHGGVFGCCSERHDFCVVFHRTSCQIGKTDMGVVGSDPTTLLAKGGNHRDEKVVFVAVREFAEDGQRIVTRNVRSCIGLYPLDECPLVVSEALNHRRAADFELALILKDRELGVPLTAYPRRREFIDQVFERGANVLDRIPKGQSQLSRGFLSDDCVQVVTNRLVGAQCFLGPEAEWFGVAFAEGSDFISEGLDVLLGPFKLQVDAAQILCPAHRLTSS